MNPLKRLKLKAMLRNCDYILAGTVIKQQYYDVNKNTEINRLIDQFMDNPGFEESLKLIGYNDIMIFYFTESCGDGLYVRKTSQEPMNSPTLPSQPTPSQRTKKSSESDEHGVMVTTRTPKKDLAKDYINDTEEGSRTNFNKTLSKEKQEIATAADPDSAPLQPISSEKSEDQSEKTRHLKQIIQESEEWMEQVIAKQHQKPKSPPAAKENLAHVPVEEQQHPEVEVVAKSVTATPTVSTLSSIAAQTKLESAAAAVKPQQEKLANTVNTVAAKLEREKLRETIAAEPQQDKLENTVTAKLQQENLIAAKLQQEQPTPAPIPKAPSASAAAVTVVETVAIPSKAAKVMRPSFPNVVATLKIDIHTMSKQLNDYRKQLASYPANEKQLKAWIQSLEEAIREFSLALDLLEGEE